MFGGADGLKTGYTREAGYGLTASAERDGVRRIVVLNGMDSSRNRAGEAERLMRAAFTEFVMIDLVESGQELGWAEVYMGVEPEVELRAVGEVAFGLHRRDRDNIIVELVYDSPLPAPVNQGDAVGRLEVRLPDGREITIPVEAGASVRRKGVFGRVGVALARIIRGS